MPENSEKEACWRLRENPMDDGHWSVALIVTAGTADVSPADVRETITARAPILHGFASETNQEAFWPGYGEIPGAVIMI